MKHDPQDDDVFSYRSSKNGEVFISWHSRQVTVLRGEAARKFLARIAGADPEAAQQLMARVTGNFKRGNER